MSGYDRWAERVERRRNRRCYSATGGFVFGMLIIAAGVLMLLDNLGLVRVRDFWDFLPLLLVALGVTKIVQGGGRPAVLVFGGLLAGAGTLWFLENIDVLRVDPRLIWPLIVIGLGVMFLVRTLERQRWAETGGIPPTTDAQLSQWAFFGGSKRIIDALDFRTADLFAVFGGVEADFRRATIVESAVIDANAVFGGVEIKVPLNWNVEVRGAGIFGGYEDKTAHPGPDALAPVPKLIVTGFAVFGGVSVSNA